MNDAGWDASPKYVYSNIAKSHLFGLLLDLVFSKNKFEMANSIIL